jgi:hypothetical protein
MFAVRVKEVIEVVSNRWFPARGMPWDIYAGREKRKRCIENCEYNQSDIEEAIVTRA